MDQIKSKSVKRNDIQILRAISVIAVILYHLDSKIFRNGFLGVDIFFIISGFVITKSLSENSQNNKGQSFKTIQILHFYRKRIYRLLPALSVTLILTLIFMLVFIPTNSHVNFFKMSIFTLFGGANVGALKFGGNNYFDPLPNPILHTWSLSVEAQLYAISPLIIFIIYKIKSKNSRFAQIMFCSNVLIYGISVSYFNNSNWFFYLPFSRLFEFSFGIFAFYFQRNFNLNHKSKIIQCAVLILLLFIPANSRVIIFFVVLLSSLFLIFPSEINKKNPNWNFFIWVGDRSYSVYLSHLPILYFLEYSKILTISSEILNKSCGLILVFLSGNFLYKKVEHKFDSFKFMNTSSMDFKLSFIFWLSPLLIFSMCLVLSTNNFISKSVFVSKINIYQIPPESDIPSACNQYSHLPCKISQGQETNYKIILIGDSQAASIWKILSFLKYPSRPTIFDASLTGCQFYLNNQYETELEIFKNRHSCEVRNKNLMNWIKVNNPNLIIIKQTEPNHEDLKEEFLLNFYINSLNWLASLKTKIIVVGPNPEFVDLDVLSGNRYVWQKKVFPSLYLKSTLLSKSSIEYNDALKSVALRNNLNYLDVFSVFCKNGFCARGINKNYYYVDKSHLSNSGARVLVPYLSSLISAN